MIERHDQDSVDDFFRDTFQFSEKTPPPPVWEKIEVELDRDKRRKFFLWWRPWAAAAVLMLAGSCLWLLQGDRSRLPGKSAALQTVTSPAVKSNKDKSPQRAEIDIPNNVPQIAPAVTTWPSAPGDPTTVVLPDLALPDLAPLLSVSQPDPSHLRIPIGRPPMPSQRSGTMCSTAHRHLVDVTPYLSQELAGYSLADHDSTGPHGREIEQRQSTSFSRSVGILVNYRFSRHWVIQSGLGFSQSVSVSNAGKVAAVKDNNGMVSYQVNTVTGYGYLSGATGIGDSATTGPVTSKLDYVSLPLALSRAWVLGRFTLLAGGGFTANFLTHATIETSLAGTAAATQVKAVTQYGLRKVNVGLQLKGECRYRISRNYAATLMTMFRNSVGPVNIHTSYSTYPYNLGIGLGVTRTF